MTSGPLNLDSISKTLSRSLLKNQNHIQINNCTIIKLLHDTDKEINSHESAAIARVWPTLRKTLIYSTRGGFFDEENSARAMRWNLMKLNFFPRAFSYK